jgi:NAD(P)-dependent dehydrogenase (short-subunit alcohol dehydrogenase family)
VSAPVVVVTGGTRGIGAGLVRAFAGRGAAVAFCGRSAEPVAATAGAVAGSLGVVADVTDPAACRRLWDETVARFGRVDIWVNNAGVTTAHRPLWELAPAEVAAAVDLNLRGLLHASAVALGGMAAQGHGALWNMEGFGSNGMRRPGMTVYGATKRAVTYATDSLAREVAGTGVTVHHLSPGMVVTDLLTAGYSEAEFARVARVLNVLADRVDTVAPWLAGRVLAGAPNGARVAWLTRRRALARFAAAPLRRRDVLAGAAPVRGGADAPVRGGADAPVGGSDVSPAERP